MKTDLLAHTAGFTWNPASNRFDIEVCDHVVASVATIAEVRAFSAMHNNGVAVALPAIPRRMEVAS